MANKHRGFVSIELDQPRKLKFTTNALAELEDALNMPLTQLGENMAGIKTIRALVWAGLLHESPNLTIDQAGNLLDYADFNHASEKVKEALELAFGNKGQIKKNKVGARNGPGQN